jgi:hypothetical protein
MTERERLLVEKLERNLFGDDGTGGAIGELREQHRSLRADLDKIKGGIAALGVIGGLLAAIQTWQAIAPTVAAFTGN